MGDLSKIEFSKLKLPTWRGGCCVATYESQQVLVMSIYGLMFEAIAIRKTPGWSIGAGAKGASLADIGALKAICEQVDAFIEAEMKNSEALTRLQLLNTIIDTLTPKQLPGNAQWGPPGPPPNPMQKALDAALSERTCLINVCMGIGESI